MMTCVTFFWAKDYVFAGSIIYGFVLFCFVLFWLLLVFFNIIEEVYIEEKFFHIWVLVESLVSLMLTLFVQVVCACKRNRLRLFNLGSDRCVVGCVYSKGPLQYLSRCMAYFSSRLRKFLNFCNLSVLFIFFPVSATIVTLSVVRELYVNVLPHTYMLANFLLAIDCGVIRMNCLSLWSHLGRRDFVKIISAWFHTICWWKIKSHALVLT